MTENRPSTHPNRAATNWSIEYDVDPIHIRDPVAEALGVLDLGEPFVITYADVVKEAGHSCPTAAGAYRIAQLGLDALYPDEYPVRSDVAVQAAGRREDPPYGVMSRIISYVTGATGDDGFGGLAGGYGGRRGLLAYDRFDAESADPTFRLKRVETDDIVEVAYHVTDVPDGGPPIGNLHQILDGSASRQQRKAFADAWHGRVQVVLSNTSLFTVEPI